MKQILQSLKTGEVELADIPCPRARSGQLLIRTRASVISSGTERMLVDFGKANLLEKARQQPDKVKMVLDKIRTDGLAPTLAAVQNKLDQPLALGYSNAGVVIDVGPDVRGFAVGDRVASNGKHAEVVSVPANLCAKIPEGVDFEAAAFTVVGAIALQGVRLVQPTLGESVVVVGLGLIGLLTVQLLRAHGCRVLGVDFDAHKLELARRFGARTVNPSAGEDPVAAAMAYSRGRGVDAVIVTASTSSSEPIHQAALMSRKRGRIVLVGVTGLELSRADFFEKELTFQVSCSYGPGRYDPLYEETGIDYPVGFVRWTEQRNFEAVLDMVADGRLDITGLVSHRFPIDDYVRAYELMSGDEFSLGVVLHYDEGAPNAEADVLRRQVTVRNALGSGGVPVLGFVGAGNYAGQVLVPAFQAAGARLKWIVSAGGASSVHVAKKFGVEIAATDYTALMADVETSAVIISTRHDVHASQILEVLAADKPVFAEKPLCLNRQELARITAAMVKTPGALLMVGFNRRFAPHAQRMKELLATVSEPKVFVATINAGQIPPDHWTQDPAVGGGRIIGEACHFIDLLRFLAGHAIVGVTAQKMGVAPGVAIRDDKMSFTLSFADGSVGTVHYLANGNKAFPKERIEVFCAGRILQLDNFRKLVGWGWPGFRKMNLWRQDKGQRACAAAFVDTVRRGGESPIPYAEIEEVTRTSFDVVDAAGR